MILYGSVQSYGPEWRTWLEIDPSVIGSGCIAQVIMIDKGLSGIIHH